jgi:hypothetical protein
MASSASAIYLLVIVGDWICGSTIHNGLEAGPFALWALEAGLVTIGMLIAGCAEIVTHIRGR